MQRIAYCLLIIIFLFTACKKKETGNIKVVGVTDVQLDLKTYCNSAQAIRLPYQTIYVIGAWQPKLSFVGIPPGIVPQIETGKDIAIDGAKIYYQFIDSVVTGTYPMKLQVTTPAGIVQEYDFIITISSYDHSYAGTYTATDTGQHADNAGSYKMTIEEVSRDRFLVHNVLNKGITLWGTSSCGNIRMSPQTIDGIIYEGVCGRIDITQKSVTKFHTNIYYKTANNPADRVFYGTEAYRD